MEFDAEGLELGESCPRCESSDTVTYEYSEGFTELECHHCGYTTEAPEIANLARFSGALKEQGSERKTTDLPPIPIKKLEA